MISGFESNGQTLIYLSRLWVFRVGSGFEGRMKHHLYGFKRLKDEVRSVDFIGLKSTMDAEEVGYFFFHYFGLLRIED